MVHEGDGGVKQVAVLQVNVLDRPQYCTLASTFEKHVLPFNTIPDLAGLRALLLPRALSMLAIASTSFDRLDLFHVLARDLRTF